MEGWFTVTTLYEEVFENKGIMELLLLDLKEEIRKQYEREGAPLGEPELQEIARLRLEDEILPQIHFKNQVEMPGKITAGNGSGAGRSAMSWEFSLKDFQNNYGSYTLEVSSRALKTPVLGLLAGGCAAAGAVLFFLILGFLRPNPKKPGPRRRP